MGISRRGFLRGSAGAAVIVGIGYLLSRLSLVQDPSRLRTEKVYTTDKFSEAADVVVIGVDIVGIMSVMCLREQRHDVVVLRKGKVAAEQSSRSFGCISSLDDPPIRLDRADPTAENWRGLSDRLGIDTSYRQNGLKFECTDDEAVAHWERWAKDNADQGEAEVEILTGDKLAAPLRAVWLTAGMPPCCNLSTAASNPRSPSPASPAR